MRGASRQRLEGPGSSYEVLVQHVLWVAGIRADEGHILVVLEAKCSKLCVFLFVMGTWRKATSHQCSAVLPNEPNDIPSRICHRQRGSVHFCVLGKLAKRGRPYISKWSCHTLPHIARKDKFLIKLYPTLFRHLPHFAIGLSHSTHSLSLSLKEKL